MSQQDLHYALKATERDSRPTGRHLRLKDLILNASITILFRRVALVCSVFVKLVFFRSHAYLLLIARFGQQLITCLVLIRDNRPPKPPANKTRIHAYGCTYSMCIMHLRTDHCKSQHGVITTYIV